MRCHEYKRWLSPYLDGVLEVSQRADLETHLRGCPNCTHDLDSLKTLQGLLRGLGKIEAPKDLLSGVHAKLTAQPWWKRLFAGWPFVLPQHGLAVALTAMLVVFVVAIPWYLRRPSEHPLSPISKSIFDTEMQNRRDAAAPVLKDALAQRNMIAPEDEVVRKGLGGGRSSPVMGGLSRAALSQGRTSAFQKPELSEQSGSESPATALSSSETSLDSFKQAIVEKSKERKGAPIQLQWAVPDRAAATARLREWLAKIEGGALSVTDGQLTVQLSLFHYLMLLPELSKYGTLTPQSRNLANGASQAQENVNVGGFQTAPTTNPQSVTQQPTTNQPLLTVEITLTAPAQ